MPQFQQVRPAGPQFAGELGGGHPLSEPPQDEEDLGGGAAGPLPGRAGEEVEHPPAVLAPGVDDRGVLAAAGDVIPVAPAAAAGAGQAAGVEQVQEPLVADP